MEIAELRKKFFELGLPTSGNKTELENRLSDFYKTLGLPKCLSATIYLLPTWVMMNLLQKASLKTISFVATALSSYIEIK